MRRDPLRTLDRGFLLKVLHVDNLSGLSTDQIALCRNMFQDDVQVKRHGQLSSRSEQTSHVPEIVYNQLTRVCLYTGFPHLCRAHTFLQLLPVVRTQNPRSHACHMAELDCRTLKQAELFCSFRDVGVAPGRLHLCIWGLSRSLIGRLGHSPIFTIQSDDSTAVQICQY